MKQEVKAWEEWVELPAYETGKPEKNPLFLEKRVYQGSSGTVYPYPVIEKIYDEKVIKKYRAFFIENEYLRIMVLPELGGRVHRAYDKIKQRDFVYYNQVIKPALVGLTGPWISGGIEFNWPQHHRPSTFLPVDCTVVDNKDGSKTIWVNEVEAMFRTKGMAGFTLYPGKAYLEVKGRVFNGTTLRQSFLWWANPAVKVNDHYQSVFPPDVYAVFDHGKRDVSGFPIATGDYYKVNYAPGTDISRYKNIPVPTSYMAIRSKYDFIGCYEHDTQAGMVHIADSHIAPGKKQWTWGNGDFGKAWDKNLTDEDGPYAELMTGVFTDNQPDFTWLQPNEHKEFEQYFMPYAGTGGIKNASKNAVINVEKAEGRVTIKIYVTAIYNNMQVKAHAGDNLIAAFACDVCPGDLFAETIDLSPAISWPSLNISVTDSANNLLVNFKPETAGDQNVPPAAQPAKLPHEIDSLEQLYLTGTHLEQYRHATFDAADYYKEALGREPGNSTCNNAMGALLLRRAQFAQSEFFFKRAIETLTERNLNPADGGPWFNLGICLQMQERFEEAYDAFFKAIWSDAYQHSAFLALARIAGRREKWDDALRFIHQSLARNYNSYTARHLEIAVLRKKGKLEQVNALIKKLLMDDPFNYGAYYEWYHLLLMQQKAEEAACILQDMKAIQGNRLQNLLEYALDYASAGLYKDAMAFIHTLLPHTEKVSPLPLYYLGWLAGKEGNTEQQFKYYAEAEGVSPDFCFPNKIDEVLILQDAIKVETGNAKPWYYLGNLWYDKKQYKEAVGCWEQSVKLDNQFPAAYRNLALAYFNKERKPQKSLAAMERAFVLDKSDTRILMELDQLYKILNMPVELRLGFLDENMHAVTERDDVYLERVALLNLSGRHEEAKTLLLERKFHPWEGGEGKVAEQYQVCLTEMAKIAMCEENPAKALSLLQLLDHYPENFGEGKLYGKPENDLDYLRACACRLLGNEEEAARYYDKATKGSSEPARAIFYNDPQPDKIFYQGMAWYKLGRPEKAVTVFRKLISFGSRHIEDEVRIDYFAVSLPDLLVFDQDLQQLNKAHCYYLQALGHLGLGEFGAADEFFMQVNNIQRYHTGASFHSRIKDFLLYTGAIPALINEK
ncbi:DUF5107 domain-containing protein [Foetidibacter luteolus]|uniref:DUF5107 domain-containing protein n=1 Tax=Foetidibacter luteolus TaxID=2608880 RepID=UPI00129A742D|nr:DUF5107 domain-containing protein [Foetidibacter luteolus]